MERNPDALRHRTKQFALRVIRLVRALPTTAEARCIAQQILRSGTSVAANYRAACRGRSRAEFVAKLGIALEEADETMFWLELLGDSQTVPSVRLQSLLTEAEELVRIFSAARNTTRHKS